jgi:hypothetical protein
VKKIRYFIEREISNIVETVQNVVSVGYLYTFSYLKNSVFFLDIAPCIPCKSDRRFRSRDLFLVCVTPSPLKLKMICSSETSVDFIRTRQLYIPGNRTLHNHRCENLNSGLLGADQVHRIGAKHSVVANFIILTRYPIIYFMTD